MCCRFCYDLSAGDDLTVSPLIQSGADDQNLWRDAVMKRGYCSPGETFPVIALNRAMRVSAFMMRWGFLLTDGASSQPPDCEQLSMDAVPPRERTSGKLVINARSETALNRVMFRESMEKRRCAIPAYAYDEWDHRQKPPVKYRFRPAGHSGFLLAGLYRWREDGRGLEFTVLTREASPEAADFHDRMPVMLPHESLRDWLDWRNPPEKALRSALTHVTLEPA